MTKCTRKLLDQPPGTPVRSPAPGWYVNLESEQIVVLPDTPIAVCLGPFPTFTEAQLSLARFRNKHQDGQLSLAL
jgi:hypothetical protein